MMTRAIRGAVIFTFFVICGDAVALHAAAAGASATGLRTGMAHEEPALLGTSGKVEGHGATKEEAGAAANKKLPPGARIVRAAYAGSESGGWTCLLEWSKG